MLVMHCKLLFKILILLWFLPVCLSLKKLYDDRDCVLYLGFDRYSAEHLFDDSQYDNKALLANGASISKTNGSCGVCAQLLGGEVIIDGKNFTGIPKTSITVALMVNLINTVGSHQLFQTIGDTSAHKEGQYFLEVIDGRIRWFHRNEVGNTVFATTTTQPLIKADSWTEIAASYDGKIGKASIYVDGTLVKEDVADPMLLSADWGLYAGIGRYKGDREMKAYVDEFYIFNKTLTVEDLKEIHTRCKGPKSSQVLHLPFENYTKNLTNDESYQGNNGYFNGDIISGVNGTCGKGLRIGFGKSYLSIQGPKFRNKPTDAVTIALWIKLDNDTGSHDVFSTTGGHSMHTHKQYDLSIIEGAVHWVHHNEYDQEIFNVKTPPIVAKNIWIHIAVTYDSTKEIAVIYVDGDIKEGSSGGGALSEDWGGIAAFGRHGTSTGGYDWFDDIFMYDRELSLLEIKTMFTKCSFVLNYGMRSKIPILAKREHTRRRRSTLDNQAQLIYFNFDRLSGNKILDDSGFENDGELINLSSLARDAGKCGHGLRLQGGNILLEGSRIKNKPKTSITIAVWINVDSADGQQEIFQTINPKAAVNKHGQYYLELSDGQLRWFHRDDNGETIFSVETPKPVVKSEVWIHIGATYQEDPGKAIVYINGEIAKEETGSKQLSQDWRGRVSIGKFYDTSDTGDWLEGRPFRGIIDEFYLYNRALSQIEISALSQVCDFRRTVLFYGFSRVEGMVVYDQSGLGNHGTLMNGTDVTAGMCGQAINFTNDGFILLDGDGFRQKPITAISITAWIRLNTNRGNYEIFNTIGSKSMHKHDQYHYAIEDGKIIWQHKDEYEKEIFSISTLAVVKPRQWINIIVTYDSQEKKAKTFLNGQLVKDDNGDGYLSQDWGHFTGIGKHYYQNTYFGGAIDELSIYNYALPDDEIHFIATAECVKK